MKRIVVIEVITFLFIFLFVYAAVSKLLDVEKFRVQISQSPLLTDYASILAWVVPIFEIIIAALLAFPGFRLIGLFTSFMLMILFTAYILSILTLGDNIPCSCGGILEHLSWNEHLIFNISFSVLAVGGVLLQTFTTREHSVK